MKKIYTAPIAEKVSFDYKEHVVASGNCWSTINLYEQGGVCISGPDYEEVVWHDNKG